MSLAVKGALEVVVRLFPDGFELCSGKVDVRIEENSGAYIVLPFIHVIRELDKLICVVDCDDFGSSSSRDGIKYEGR